jgi:DNA-directed RNA polymerase specialized sigma24 family protein
MEAVARILIRLRKLLISRGRTVDDADDLIQEAFLRLEVYCRDHQVRQPEAFLVRTTLNLSIQSRAALDITQVSRNAYITPDASTVDRTGRGLC